jgi:hypothetical protein
VLSVAAVLGPRAIVEQHRSSTAAAVELRLVRDGEGMAEVRPDAADARDPEVDDRGTVDRFQLFVDLAGAETFDVLDAAAVDPGEAGAVGIGLLAEGELAEGRAMGRVRGGDGNAHGMASGVRLPRGRGGEHDGVERRLRGVVLRRHLQRLAEHPRELRSKTSVPTIRVTGRTFRRLVTAFVPVSGRLSHCAGVFALRATIARASTLRKVEKNLRRIRVPAKQRNSTVPRVVRFVRLRME